MNELDNILKNLDEQTLQILIDKVRETQEYKVLKQKTQIKNSAVEKGSSEIDKNLTNRQTHTLQVSEVAYTIVKASGMSEKEALVAKLVGLCHDLGHTPFGHDGENFFEEKTGKRFSHAKYGAKIFDKIFTEILDSKEKRTGQNIFDESAKENLKDLRDYIKAGVNFHQDCYYIYQLDKQLSQPTNHSQQALLEKAIQNPCIQAGMLADTVAFMQSDVRDLLNTKNPFDSSKTVISIEDQMKVAKAVGFTPEAIKTMQNQLLKVGQMVDIDNLQEDEALRKILEKVGNMNMAQLQGLMAREIGEQSLQDGKFQSIPDEYKLLLDNNEKGYKELIEFKPKKTHIPDWKTFRNEELAKQRGDLMQKNPLLCLIYEIQNELMYGTILKQENIKILNNDVERNKAMFCRVYDYLYEVTDKSAAELRVKDLEIRKEMLQIRKNGDYPRQFNEKMQDGSANRKAIVTNLVIYKMQQMGNQQLKDFYQEKLASKEKSLEIEVETLEREGKSEDEITYILQGMDEQNYEEFKKEEQKIRGKVANFQTKTNQETASKYNVEKRDIDEIKAGKTILSRNLEYNMTYQEMEQVAENLGKGELEQKSDMASFVWSSNMNEGEEFVVDMEMLVRNALAYVNITTEDVKQAENIEKTIANQDKITEGVKQRGE